MATRAEGASQRATIGIALEEQAEVLESIRELRTHILDALCTAGPPATPRDAPEPSNHVVRLRQRIEDHTAELKYHQEVLGQILDVLRGL